jgi:hypothetical protein
VRAVTQGAVFRHWGVLPQKRAAFLLVTAETVVIECNLVQVRVTQPTVGIVAIGAGGHTLGDGVARGQAQLRAYLLVAVEAELIRLPVVQGEIPLLV